MTVKIDLSGKTALVTGLSSGIGLRLLEKLIESGCDTIYIHSSGREESVKNAQLQLGRLNTVYGFHVQGPFVADISDSDEVEAMVEQIAGCGRLDIVINNAGMNIDKLVMRMKKKEFSEVINTNLCGTFYCCQEAFKIMSKQNPKGGNIINISSVVGTNIVNIGQVNYAASKAGIIALTEHLALEYAPYKVLVNAVSPGFVNTGMTNRLPERINKEEIKEALPLKRFAIPDDIFQAIIPLLDSDSYITGTNILVDGGLSLIR